MISDSGNTTSLWMATAEVPKQPVLTSDTRADVCIVGAGIAGLSTAYHLAKEGRSVVVLERAQIGADASARTTAHLSNAIDDRYVTLERIHGADGARLAAESHTAAIDRIERIVRHEGIDCGFERLDGYLFVPPGEEVQILRDEADAARRAGLADVRMVDRAPLPAFDTGPALMFPRQGQFHILNYLSGLARAIERLGGRIFMGTHVSQIDGGKEAVVKTSCGATVTAGSVVVTTNSPINDQVTIHTKQAPYRTYAVGLRIPNGVVPRALYWDTPDPYHYVRLAAGADGEASEVLIVGGEDHKTGQADDMDQRWRNLAAWARQRFPMAGDAAFRWSGQVLETIDGLAFIGRNPGDEPNVYIATGDSGHGMTHGTLAGMILSDLIAGRPNPWSELYDPARRRLWSWGDWLKENFNAAAQLRDYVTGGDVSSTDEIAVGEGAVMRRGLHKVAVYRDETGALHECSAVCPHLGGIVRWNAGEKCWDCPLHGSHFDPLGEVIAGPAASDLTPAKPMEEPTTTGAGKATG